MTEKQVLAGPRKTAVLGLLLGAFGIGILWVSKIEFPFYPPPGILIMVAGAIFIALARWRWAPIAGVFIGLFLVVGFLASAGMDNLTGNAAAPASALGASIGSAVQMLGVLVALFASALALKQSYQKTEIAN